VSKEIEQQIARVLERRNGLGDAANISVTFERDLRELQLDAAHTGDMRATIVRFDPRNGRFDITFEIPNDVTYTATKLRFTGVAVETVEAAVLTRAVERNDILKSSDVVVERRPKAEVGNDIAIRDRAVGMQARKQMRAGQALKAADLGKPDMVSRDQSVTLIYEAPGLYLTGRGKALDSGTEGDTVNIVNLQSKRTVQGVVTGPGQVSIVVPGPRLTTAALSNSAPPAASESKKPSNQSCPSPTCSTASSSQAACSHSAPWPADVRLSIVSRRSAKSRNSLLSTIRPRRQATSRYRCRCPRRSRPRSIRIRCGGTARAPSSRISVRIRSATF
jgi:flagella basal body P-ring formation protein FlgA